LLPSSTPPFPARQPASQSRLNLGLSFAFLHLRQHRTNSVVPEPCGVVKEQMSSHAAQSAQRYAKRPCQDRMSQNMPLRGCVLHICIVTFAAALSLHVKNELFFPNIFRFFSKLFISY
jgi:hypothetical protein